MDGDGSPSRERSPFLRRLSELAFQGHPPIPYLRAASKTLFAGFLGVVAGWVAQPFFSTVLAVPYWVAYWPAVILGFVVNLRTQMKLKNINVPKATEQSPPD